MDNQATVTCYIAQLSGFMLSGGISAGLDSSRHKISVTLLLLVVVPVWLE